MTLGDTPKILFFQNCPKSLRIDNYGFCYRKWRSVTYPGFWLCSTLTFYIFVDDVITYMWRHIIHVHSCRRPIHHIWRHCLIVMCDVTNISKMSPTHFISNIRHQDWRWRMLSFLSSIEFFNIQLWHCCIGSATYCPRSWLANNFQYRFISTRILYFQSNFQFMRVSWLLCFTNILQVCSSQRIPWKAQFGKGFHWSNKIRIVRTNRATRVSSFELKPSGLFV